MEDGLNGNFDNVYSKRRKEIGTALPLARCLGQLICLTVNVLFQQRSCFTLRTTLEVLADIKYSLTVRPFPKANKGLVNQNADPPEKALERDRPDCEPESKQIVVSTHIHIPHEWCQVKKKTNMSKYDIQNETKLKSEITVEESEEAAALSPSIYDRIGEDGFIELSTLFYERVFADTDAPYFLNLFSSSTKREAIDNQYSFLVQTFGGPDLYRQRGKGKYTRLVGRHANYAIGTKAADRWFYNMEKALEEHSKLAKDDEARVALSKYFRYTAHYIVSASQFMRPDQLSGGTVADSGRNW
jgi:truncated hemoglobin YjbI